MKIEVNKTVSAEYELYVGGENGEEQELMECATAENPLTFVFGLGMMLPKFESNLFGLQKGNKFDFVISKEDAYGEYFDENIIDLEKQIFEIDGKVDETVIFEGNLVPLMDSEGHRVNAQIVKITDTHVTVDINHPLSGEDLHFVGSILDVHDVTEDELKTMIGTGCGCDCGGCDDGCGDDEHSNDSCGCGSSCGCR